MFVEGKSAALLAAPGVLDPTAFFACFNILLGNALVGVRPSRIEIKTWQCCAHVGSFFALGCIFFAFGRFWNAPWIFFAHVNFFSGVGVAQNSILVGARRGRPHGMDMCLDIPAWIPLGEARASKLQTKILSW